MSKSSILLTVFLLVFAFSAFAEDAQPPASKLTPEVLAYVAEKYFPGVKADDPKIVEAISIISPAKEILDLVSALEWEKGQLDNFAANKLLFVLTLPDGSKRVLKFRAGKKRDDHPIDESRERVLRRLYSAGSLAGQEDKQIQRFLSSPGLEPTEVFSNAWKLALTRPTQPLDDSVMERARKNLLAERTRTSALTRALAALSNTEYGPDCCWAALWLISRMDGMSFNRYENRYTIPDLEAIDARTFYENVFYAVCARKEFPWATGISDRDFLQFVLSPRATGEPLQRWRRHFYEALQPEVAGLKIEDVEKARMVAANAYGDYFQYEGDTTWEDFGLLTSLAVMEGRCEDCSNVLNAMYWAIGIPACQAFTPFWGHANGNHAWTWVRGIGKPPGDGANGVKVYVKTWDGYDDVTEEYSPVTKISLITKSTSNEPCRLMVWNEGEWHSVMRSSIVEGRVEFEKVGCRLNFALLADVAGDEPQLLDVRPDGSVRVLNSSAEPHKGDITVNFDKMSPLGEFKPDVEYSVEYAVGKAWKPLDSERLPTGAIGFTASKDRLYRILGTGFTDRPFTVELAADGTLAVIKR